MINSKKGTTDIFKDNNTDKNTERNTNKNNVKPIEAHDKNIHRNNQRYDNL